MNEARRFHNHVTDAFLNGRDVSMLPLGVGRELARLYGMMSKLKVIDRRPGVVPDIRAHGDSVIFEMPVTGGRKIGACLVIRCDANGDAWLSIGDRPRNDPDSSAS